MSKKFIEKDGYIIGSAVIPDLVGGFISLELYQALSPEERVHLQAAYEEYGQSAARADFFNKKAFDPRSVIDYMGTAVRKSEKADENMEYLTGLIEKYATEHGYTTESEEHRKSL